MIDLDPDASNDELPQLLATVLGTDDEDHIAWRGAERYVARLVPRRPLEQRMGVRASGSYLITGGLGALGLAVARWLVAEGARNLILVGRRGALAESATAVEELERAGARILVERCDVSNRADVARLLERIASTMPPLYGIVHAAGVADERPIRDVQPETLAAALRPKVQGTWWLHALTQHLDLEMFIMFSSISSVWGSSDLAQYAAANHFLDMFAHYRRAMGLAAVSVNWGPWGGGGMATTQGLKFMNRLGMREFEPDQAAALLGGLEGVTQVAAVDIDWSTFRSIYEAERPRPLLEQLDVRREESAQLAAVSATESARQRMEEAAPEERSAVVTELVREHAAAVLGMRGDAIDVDRPIKDYGLDSLMAVDLRNRIDALGVAVPVRNLLQGISVGLLAADVLAQLVDGESPEENSTTSCVVADAAAEVVLVNEPLATNGDNPWLVRPSPNPQAQVRLFCFPYAGGGPAVFHNWAKGLPSEVELCVIQSPGRAARLFEEPFVRMEDKVGAMVPALRPYLVAYLHSCRSAAGRRMYPNRRRRTPVGARGLHRSHPGAARRAAPVLPGPVD
jgi:NADP-dependent 3-hydroxy acid dehydrogenase YdfG/aryl carrier-like protein